MGTFFCYLGYRLFLLRVTTAESRFAAEWRGISIALNSTAPGMFFSLFGTVIISFTIMKGLNFDASLGLDPTQQTYPQKYATFLQHGIGHDRATYVAGTNSADGPSLRMTSLFCLHPISRRQLRSM